MWTNQTPYNPTNHISQMPSDMPMSQDHQNRGFLTQNPSSATHPIEPTISLPFRHQCSQLKRVEVVLRARVRRLYRPRLSVFVYDERAASTVAINALAMICDGVERAVTTVSPSTGSSLGSRSGLQNRSQDWSWERLDSFQLFQPPLRRLKELNSGSDGQASGASRKGNFNRGF